MAEPISVAASIAGLVTLADIVFGRIFKYVQTARRADKEITSLSSEIGSLYGILSRLNLVSRQLEDQTVGSAPRLHYIGSCQETLEKVRTILDRDIASSAQTQHVDKVKRKLRWPFNSSEVKSLLADIERHKSALGLALNVDGATGLLQSLSLQGKIRDTLDEIKQDMKLKHEADVRIAIDTKRQSILRSFGNIDPCQNQKMSVKLRQPGTGYWLIESQEFRAWCQNVNRKLWLYGIPGAGKTILASSIIEETLRGSNVNHAVAYFFCDYKDPATQKPQFILGSLIQQIAKQDEQAFEKVAIFCDQRNPEHKKDYDYDCHELRNLILDISSSFDNASIIVDGLDECGSNAAEATELLASLHPINEETNMKTLFLSRNELEIRQCLESYVELAIAARSSDLRLYVGAEIESRIRRNKLRIKDHSLKEQIMEKLVGGAEGMFRWVACQMDYLCELPNDSSRRKELGNLPKTLHATYERILRRVNARNYYAQLLVSRILRWIVHHSQFSRPMSTEALCEAVSIDVGDTERDLGSISDEHEILLWCSSLIRKSTDGESLELAHFTVEEFLRQIEDDDEGEFAMFRVGRSVDDIYLAKSYLTYLNFQDFNKGGCASKEATERRFEQYPLRECAIGRWHLYAQSNLDDEELLCLVKRLLNPSKPGTYISLVQDLIFSSQSEKWSTDEVHTLVAETNPLHFAATLNLPEVCSWLIGDGCNVDQDGVLGSPLWCSIAWTKLGIIPGDERCLHRRAHVTRMLLEAGADPNVYRTSYGNPESLLYISLREGYWESASELLKIGVKLDESSLVLIESRAKVTPDGAPIDSAISSMIELIRVENLQDEHRARVAKLCLSISKSGTADTPNISELIGLGGKDAHLRNIDRETALRAAARFGQVQIVAQLLEVPSIDVEATEEETGLTALHYAAMNDNLEISKLLLTYGAQCSKTDSRGRTAAHHAARNSWRCLEYFLGQGANTILCDYEGLALWHDAAYSKGTKNLNTLRRHLTPITSLKEMKTNAGWTPLLCAASSGYTECVAWLLQAGCTVKDRANDGSTALHLASQSGSPRTVQLLLDNGSDVDALTLDGSTALFYAMLSLTEGVNATVDLLLQHKIDISRAREDGIMPIHLLLAHNVNTSVVNEKEKATLMDLILNDGSTALSTIIGSPKEARHVLEVIFDTFMEHKMDLGSRSSRSNRVLRSLADVWRMFCKKERHSNLTTYMHMALEKIPLTGPLHTICTDPNLIISALEIEDEELVYKLLEHSPDVDAKSDGWSIMTTACAVGCSRRLFKQLLMRSSTATKKHTNPIFLHLACESSAEDSLGTVSFLLSEGFDPNERHPINGLSPLMVAARNGNDEKVQLLISHGADTNIIDKLGLNVVHHTCIGDHKEILHSLRATQVDWNCKGVWYCEAQHRSGVSPFHIAATLEDHGTLEYLIDEGLVSDIDMTTDDSETALLLATWFHRHRNVASLLSRNANVMIRSILDGQGPLHVAARSGCREIVSLLLQYQSDTEGLDDSGLTAELLARKYNHKDVAEMLKEHGEKQAQISATLLKSTIKRSHTLEALRTAIDLVDIDLCRRIIDDGVNLSLGFEACHGCPPLLYALGKGTPLDVAAIEIVELLAREAPSIRGKACDINHKTKNFTTLHYAAAFGYFHLLQILLEKDPMMVLELYDDIHPVHMAIRHGHYSCVELIILHYEKYTTHPCSPSPGRPWNARSTLELVNLQVAQKSMLRLMGVKNEIRIPENVQSMRPLHNAASYGHTQIAKHLLVYGASVDATDKCHSSALHYASIAGNDETSMVELLLSHGANPQAVDDTLTTPLMDAARNGNLNIVQALVAGGADCQAQNFWGRTAFHEAAKFGSIPTIQFLLGSYGDYNLGCEDNQGSTPLLLLLALGSWNNILFAINLAPNPSVYEPRIGNILASAVESIHMTPSLLKKLLRRLSSPLVAVLLNHQAKNWSTPLYTACTIAHSHQQEDFINILLQAGADLEQDAGRHGTPLMGACAAGRFEVVKLLVSKGAQISYQKEGTTISALDAAKHFPEIVRWLLVERYTMGPKRLC